MAQPTLPTNCDATKPARWFRADDEVGPDRDTGVPKSKDLGLSPFAYVNAGAVKWAGPNKPLSAAALDGNAPANTPEVAAKADATTASERLRLFATHLIPTLSLISSTIVTHRFSAHSPEAITKQEISRLALSERSPNFLHHSNIVRPRLSEDDYVPHDRANRRVTPSDTSLGMASR